MQPPSMMRFCGNCGVQLFGPAIAAGRCLSCGFPITDTVSASEAQAIAAQYQQQESLATVPASEADVPTDERLTQPNTYVGGAAQKPPPKRRGLWVILPVLLAALVLFFFVWWRTTHSSATTANRPPVVVTRPPATSPAPGVSATAVLGGAATPTPTLAPGNTPLPGQGTPLPGAPPTSPPATTAPSDGQPSITVSQTTFSQLLCAATTITFTVTNSGGGVLNYQVTSTSLLPYTINPKSGSLSAGDTDTVRVTNINTAGTITVSAPGATNTSTISIQCA